MKKKTGTGYPNTTGRLRQRGRRAIKLGKVQRERVRNKGGGTLCQVSTSGLNIKRKRKRGQNELNLG